MLDQHLDKDHNRTVITFVGPLRVVEESAFLAIETAAELIDPNDHKGKHPRIGAADVVPFVPVSGVSVEDCVEIIRWLWKKVAGELGVPIYLYEAAALRLDRKNLENIRKGEYEGLKMQILVEPDRAACRPCPGRANPSLDRIALTSSSGAYVRMG